MKHRRMKRNIAIAILVALAVFMIIPFARAEDILGQDCEEAYLFEPGSEMKCEVETKFNIWTNFFVDSNDFIMEGVKESTKGYRDISVDNPKVKEIKNDMLLIANALAVLVITYAGYVYIVSATDPKKRDTARRQLTAGIYMLIFLNAGFFIANLGYDLGTDVASYLESDTEDFFEETPWVSLKNENPGNDVEATYEKFSSLAVVSPILMISGWGYTSLMYLRNMVILLLLALAPLIVVLFFFEPTKPYGLILALIYGIELFLPVIFFPLFKVAGLMFSSNNRINILIMSAALMVGVLLHLIIVGVAMIKAAGTLWVKEED
ncbi:hypothetical protein JW707_01060 [Candidatus Woesearchaeota archaeon]|nr:hypothetical protein [Candidatus Woesearchaeota archaeon]